MELQSKKETYAENGIAYLTVSCTLPHWDEKTFSAAEKFYRTVQEAIFRLAEEKLFPKEQERYESDPDPRKRFTHRPLQLSVLSQIRETRGGTQITRTVALSRRGHPLYRRESVETVTAGGTLLPIKQKKRTKTDPGKKS